MDALPLKDIHLPEPITWWPPAIGWWLLAILLPVLIATGIFLYRRLRQKTALKTARKMLEALKHDKQRDTLQTLIALSAWLRRVAISLAPRGHVAGLRGEAWLNYLDAAFQDEPFSRGVGRCMADAPYRQNLPDTIDLDALFELCERWLKFQRGGKGSKK